MNWPFDASMSFIALSRLPLRMRWPFVVHVVANTQSLWFSNFTCSLPSVALMMRTTLSAPAKASRVPSGDQEMP